MVIHFGGSRSLSSSLLLRQVVSASLAAGHSVHVGCARGADQQVIAQVCAARQLGRLSVFAVGGQSGAGFWSGSAFGLVSSAAAAGASVSWWAGGPGSVPLAARLIRRSVAALAGCQCSVFFLAQPASPGSLAVAAQAVQRGLPVFAFCSSVPAPLRGQCGSWVASSFLGFGCWLWACQPALF